MSSKRVNSSLARKSMAVRAMLLAIFFLAGGGYLHAATASGFGPGPIPVPFIQSITPLSVAPGGAAFTLTVNGANFVPASVVYWGTTALTTTFVSISKLTAAVPQAQIAWSGTGWITVNNPPQVGNSNVFFLPVQASVATLVYAQLSNTAGSGASNAVQGDFNNDGKLDLAVSNEGDGTVSIFLGNGDGTFQAQALITLTVSDPFGMAVGDLNHDGNMDLVVGTDDDSGVVVLLGNGDGTFHTPVTLSGGNSLLMPILADVDRDGNLDIICGVYDGAGIDVYLGNGDGTFQTVAVTGTTLTGVSNIAAADLRGNGALDLVAISWFGDENAGLNVLLGNGNGTFENAVNYGPPGTWNLVVGDFNEDGKIDIVTTADDSATGYLFYAGAGDGTLAAGQPFGSGVSYSIAAGDLNGDGHLDIIGMDIQGEALDVSLGNGDGTFQTVKSFGAGTGEAFQAVIGNFGTGAGLAIAAPDGTSNLFLFEQTVTLSPDSISFGAQPVGTPTEATDIVVTNSTSSVVTLVGFTFTGPNALDFSETDNCMQCSDSLGVGGTCTVHVTFTPSITGAESAVLNLTDNAPASPQTAPLTGTGTAPPVATAVLSTNVLNYAADVVGTPSTSQIVTISNGGGTVLTITSIAIAGTNAGDFHQTNNCGVSLQPSGPCTITVTFTPVAGGARTANIILTDSAASSPQTVQLNGIGEDFTLAFVTNTQSVAPGATASFQLGVTPLGGFGGVITLTCAGAPANSTCVLTPSQFTPGLTPTTITVALVTRAGIPATEPFGDRSRRVPVAYLRPVVAIIGFGLLLLAGWPRRKTLRRRAAVAQFACVLAGVVLLAAVGLGGCGYTASTSTKSGSYPLTITASSGTLSHSAGVTVIVQ
jgi:FG-GAP-like repeat